MKVFITGISGFAGSYLGKFLLNKGYEVFGTTFSKNIRDSYAKVFKTSPNLRKYVYPKEIRAVQRREMPLLRGQGNCQEQAGAECMH